MGYLQAVYDLGRMAKRTEEDYTQGEFDSYLQMPMPETDDPESRGREIRVWLEVEDIGAEPLKILGVHKLDLCEYPCVAKEKYLYRDPVGNSATWKFSPIYRLGAGKGIKELMGHGSEKARSEMLKWLLGEIKEMKIEISSKEDEKYKENRYYKLKNATLDAFEEEGVWAPGSVNIIMAYLVKHAQDLAALWSDRKRSYILLFGLEDKGRFLYPGEIPTFKNYFRKKLNAHLGGEKAESKSKAGKELFCSLCGQKSGEVITVDKLFVFATFDKSNFLPAMGKSPLAEERAYPLCAHCFSALSQGKTKIREKFSDNQTLKGLNGLNIDIIPELLLGTSGLPRIADNMVQFLTRGFMREENFYRRMAEAGEGLVYHFLFWESNQKQERIHLLVEDVPPTRIKKIVQKWQEAKKIFKHEDSKNEEATLDTILKFTYGILMSLAGKNKEEQKNMREKWLKAAGQLLLGEDVNIQWLKALMVSRFPGLFGDQDWVRKEGSKDTKDMLLLIDFFERMKGR